MSIIYEKKGQMAYITINRPHVLNAIDPKTNQELEKVWLDFRDDPEVWVAILTGAGDKAFCSGVDLNKSAPGMGPKSALMGAERRQGFSRGPGFGTITRGFETWKPIIAAINGHCLAGGLEIALACDIRIASDTASFGMTQVRWGMIPGAGGTQRLPRLIPFGKAVELCITGEIISAEEALRYGIINHIVSPEELLEEAQKMAEKICERGPLAVRAVKELILRGMKMPLDEALCLEFSLLNALLETEDAREGFNAFAEKRKPRFKGR